MSVNGSGLQELTNRMAVPVSHISTQIFVCASHPYEDVSEKKSGLCENQGIVFADCRKIDLRMYEYWPSVLLPKIVTRLLLSDQLKRTKNTLKN